MAQDQKESSGFTLPPPQVSSNDSAASTANMSEMTTSSTTVNLSADTSSRDMLIGGGILLLLFIAFFFAKNAYANTLVGKRVPPNKANAAGWWLFIFLATLATGVVLAAVNSGRFLTSLIIGPIAAVALVALVLVFISGRK